MTAQEFDLPSRSCAVCGGADCPQHLGIAYDPNRPFVVHQYHPPIQGPDPEPPPRPKRRSEDRMRRIEADTAHHSSEDTT